MIRKKERELTPYEKYFMEAPARRPYMRIISAFPDGRLKRFDTNMELPPEDDETDTPENNADLDLVDDTDFSANIGTDEPDEPIAQDDGGLETEPPADAAEPVPENDPQEADAQTDVPAEEPVEPTDQPTEGDTAETPDNPDEGLETEPPADTGTDAPTDDDTDAVGGGEGELAADDNTDFSANIDADDAGDEGGGEDVEADDTEDGTSQTGQTNNTENQLKFSLYRNLKNLYITIQNYESGNRNPSNLIIVQRLADILGTTTEYLLDCPESSASESKKEDGSKAVPNNIHDLVEKITGLFTDGSLDEDTLDDAMKALSDAYWAAKGKNKRHKAHSNAKE